MIINKSLIKTLNPCKDRFDNYLLHYSNESFTVQQFMGLKRITHNDKVWVTLRLLSKNKLRLAAADIAESVLHIFENKYPNDKRPRLAIEAARRGAAATYADTNDIAAAAYAATAAAAANADYANDTAATYAAYAAAAYTDYAAAAYTDYAAADARSSSKARKTQEKLIRKIIIGYLIGRK